MIFHGTQPTKAHEQDAGWDLRSAASVVIPVGQRRLVPTGTRVTLPVGTVGLVCPRSGLAARQGLTVLNAPGVIDPGYTGDIGVILHNTGEHPAHIHRGDRIAQLVILPTHPTPTTTTAATRGAGGFGSTGR